MIEVIKLFTHHTQPQNESNIHCFVLMIKVLNNVAHRSSHNNTKQLTQICMLSQATNILKISTSPAFYRLW